MSTTPNQQDNNDNKFEGFEIIGVVPIITIYEEDLAESITFPDDKPLS